MYFLKIIVVVILIAGAVFFGLRILSPEDNWICQDGTWKQHGKPSSPMPTTPCAKETVSPSATLSPENIASDQKEYKNSKMGFSVMLHKDLNTAENLDGTISFSKWGPTQKIATELFDGFSINIDQGELGAYKDLKSLIEADINQKKEQLFPDFKLIKTISQVQGGYFFQTQELFGSVDYYYLTQSGDKFLLISVIQIDPGDLGFEKMVTDIISGITMTN